MSETTRHGENVANEIQGVDAYGDDDNLTDADVWNILDQIESHMLSTREPGDPIFDVLKNAMDALIEIDDDLPL